MVEYSPASLDSTFAALSDPTRRGILARLRGRPAKVTELAAPFAMSLNAISKHIRVLEQAGLVSRRVAGRDHYLSLDAAPLRAATTWMEHYRHFWETRLDQLDQYLREGDAHARRHTGNRKHHSRDRRSW